jgi:hypothetical protein
MVSTLSFEWVLFLYKHRFESLFHLDLTNESINTYFIDNQRTVGHQSVIFGIRELNATEIDDFCSNYSLINDPPISNTPYNFSSNYELRTYTSGCYYLDSNNNWQSDGLLVSFRLDFHWNDSMYLFHSGRIFDKSLSNTLFIDTSDNIYRWFSSFTSTN